MLMNMHYIMSKKVKQIRKYQRALRKNVSSFRRGSMDRSEIGYRVPILLPPSKRSIVGGDTAYPEPYKKRVGLLEKLHRLPQDTNGPLEDDYCCNGVNLARPNYNSAQARKRRP